MDASHIKEDSCGVTGYVISYGKCPIIWRSKKQKIVTLSSAESEIVALCDALREVSWLRDIIMEIGIGEPTIKIFEDNKACIDISKNAIVNDRTRHVIVGYMSKMVNHCTRCFRQNKLASLFLRTTVNVKPK